MIAVTTLRQTIPSDRPKCAIRESLNGRPNLRYQAETNGLPWTVDIYLGHYYRAHVGSATGEVFRSLPSLIGYLTRTLGVENAVSD